jgi:hypothetical protein
MHADTFFDREKWRICSGYLLAWYAKILEPQSASDKQLLEVTNFRFKLSHMGFDPFPYSLQKFWYANLFCNMNQSLKVNCNI